MRHFLALAFVAVLVMGVARAQAQDLPEGFYGAFEGLGLSETVDDGKVVDVKPRDFDVRIEKIDGGFRMSWKTTEYTIRPRNSRLDKENETVVFMKSERPGLFGEKQPGDLASGDPVYWARISFNTLDVYRLSITEDGRHELAVWQRNLSGDQINLIFQRSGETAKPRIVKGTLSRVKP